MRINKSLLCAFLAFLAIVCFSAPNSFAGFGDGLTDSEKRRLFSETRQLFQSLKDIIRDLKKVNIRLTDLETSDIESLKQTHVEILTQVEMLQKLIPSLQGIVELSQSELTQRIDSLSTGVAQVQSNIEMQRQQQEKNQEAFRNGMLADLGQLRHGIKEDMETFAALNKQSFDDFSKINSEAFEKIVANLNVQSQKMAEASTALINLLRTELVPAIQDTMIQNFTGMASKNDKMIELLKQNLAEQQAANQKVALLDEKISRIAEVLEVVKNQNNSVGTSLNTLHASVAHLQEITSHAEDNISKQNDVAVKTLETYSDQLGQKIDQSLVKIDESAANDKLSQEKIDKMIEILQTAMVNGSLEEKLDLTVQKIEEGQANANLANEKLSKLIEILKTIVTAQTGLEQIKENQGAIKEALADLRRKANVNISRNDDIKKFIKKMQKTTPVPAQ